MSVLGRGWGRFRRLPVAAQVLAGLLLLAAYTLALVVILGGGDDDDASGERQRPLTALEKQVKQRVEKGQVPQRDETDVAAFRRANVADVRCDEGSCSVTYSIAVPGRGRVALQQVDIVRRIFAGTDVEELELTVVRGQPTGPLASPKSQEETPVGVPLYETTCERDKAPADVDWKRLSTALRAFDAACEIVDVFSAGPGGAPGAPGTGGGGSAE